MDLELNIPHDNLKQALQKLVDGPNSSDYPTVSEWSCSFISYENFCKNDCLRSFEKVSKESFMSFEEYANYVEESVYEQSFWIGEKDIVFFDANETKSVMRISFVDVKTSRQREFVLHFHGFNQPFFKTNLRLVTFWLEDIHGANDFFIDENIGATLFILEALNVTFGTEGSFWWCYDYLKEAFKAGNNQFTSKYLLRAGLGKNILIIGNQLADYYGIELLKRVQSFAKWERPNSLFLYSSPNNLYHLNGRLKTIALTEYDYDIILPEHNRTVFESEDVYNKHYVYGISLGVSSIYSISNLIDLDIELTLEED